jgi:endoglycosylceramidase
MRMMRPLALAALLLTTSRASAGALHSDGGFVRDEHNAVVILRGVDVASNSKVPPFAVIDRDELLDPLPDLGVNVLRLLFTWEAYEPVRGQYDDGYLAYYKRVVAAAAARGLYVVVDFHQDAFSRWSLGGCGDGFPQWAVVSTVAQAPPDNGPNCAEWGTLMLSDPGLQKTWDAFYADTEGARGAYLAMVGRVAAALAGTANVIGYDLLNEPGGDEVTQIGPLYEAAAPIVRAADPSAILFLSPGVITSAGSSSDLPRPSFDNVVFAQHYYDPTLFLFHGWQGSDEAAAFGRMTTKAASWGAPLFVGEYGAAADTDQVDGYLSAMTTQLDLALAGGAQWAFTPGWTDAAKDGWNTQDFSIVDGQGRLRANFRVRPYPRRIPGTPTALTVGDALTLNDPTVSHDPKTNVLELTWMHDPFAGAVELYLPGSYFGGDVEVQPDGDVKCKRSGALFSCSSYTAGPKRLRAVAPSPACGLTGAEALLVLALVRRRRSRRS